MKKLYLFIILGLLFIGDSQSDQKKYNFTFTLDFNDITLTQAGEIEEQLSEDYPNANIKLSLSKEPEPPYIWWRTYDNLNLQYIPVCDSAILFDSVGRGSLEDEFFMQGDSKVLQGE